MHLYTQRVSINNTKPDTVVENLRILEQIPVSEDDQINVKLIAPPLARAEADLHVQEGVVARWDSEDQDSDDGKAPGKTGRVTFACKVPAQGKISLMLQWEVSTASVVSILGL